MEGHLTNKENRLLKPLTLFFYKAWPFCHVRHHQYFRRTRKRKCMNLALFNKRLKLHGNNRTSYTGEINCIIFHSLALTKWSMIFYNYKILAAVPLSHTLESNLGKQFLKAIWPEVIYLIQFHNLHAPNKWRYMKFYFKFRNGPNHENIIT